jgi:hypothetical protein
MIDIMIDTIEALDNLFFVRKDCYPKKLDKLNQYIVVKKPLTTEIIQSHLDGDITIGCFQIEPETNKVKWICFDFDGKLTEEFEKAHKLFNKLKDNGFNPLMEFSGRRGYHIWLFIEPIDSSEAKRFAVEISKDVNPNEIFPKQDKLDKKGYGCQVKLPLGIHRVSNKRSYFFNQNFKPLSQKEGINFLIKLSKEKEDKINITNIKSYLR